MPLPMDRMPTTLRTPAAEVMALRRTVTELRAARRQAVAGPWQDIDVANDWGWAGGTWAQPQVRRLADGTVQLLGSLAPGTLTAGTVIATLPYLPVADLEWRVGGGSSTAGADLYVLASGALTIQNASGTPTRIGLAGISFPSA